MLPSKVTGKSYRAIWEALNSAAGNANGFEPSAQPLPWPLSGSFVPRLSNGEAVAVIRAWRRAASRSRVQAWPWYELTIDALGWKQEGDRFDMSIAHSKAAYELPELAMLWASTAELAEDLDDDKTVVRPLYVDSTRAGYEAGAREAWERMKAELKLPMPPGIDPPDIVIPEPTDPDKLPLPRVPSPGFPWWLLLVVGGVYLASRED